MEVLFATNNPAKIKYYATELIKNGIDVITIKDLDKKINIEENGKDAIENAKIKAETYYKETGMITIGVDDNLFFEGLSDDKQPKTNVRRINGKRLNDQEVLDYYRQIVHELGGKTNGYWLHGIAICKNGKTTTFEKRTDLLFTEERSNIISEGYPLDAMTYMPEYNKFLSELTEEEQKERKSKNDGKNQKMIQYIIQTIKN